MKNQQYSAMLAGLAVVVLMSCFPLNATAAFVSMDLTSAGDGNITLDESTGIQWLDLNLTNGQALNASNAYTADGWQVATSAQVQTMIGNFFALSPVVDGARHTVDQAQAEAFISLFGVTYTEATGMSWGRFLNSTGSYAGQAVVRADSLVSYLINDGNAYGLSEPHSFSGVFYVKQGTSAVPLPAAVWLLASGLGMFGFLGKRKRAA